MPNKLAPPFVRSLHARVLSLTRDKDVRISEYSSLSVVARYARILRILFLFIFIREANTQVILLRRSGRARALPTILSLMQSGARARAQRCCKPFPVSTSRSDIFVAVIRIAASRIDPKTPGKIVSPAVNIAVSYGITIKELPRSPSAIVSLLSTLP